MNKPFKPSGYNSLSPYFVVAGAQKLIDLLKQIFNAKELRRYNGEGRAIMHAELQIDDTVIMLADSTKDYPPNQLLVHIYVPDVQKTFEKAVSLSCKADQKPEQKEGDPDVRGMFRDFAGNMWAVGTQV